MGTIAGNFLHEIFEHIDFKDTHIGVWKYVVVLKMIIQVYGRSYWKNISRLFQRQFE
jgi:exodeoxyribonuclease V beta subunit